MDLILGHLWYDLGGIFRDISLQSPVLTSLRKLLGLILFANSRVSASCDWFSSGSHWFGSSFVGHLGDVGLRGDWLTVELTLGFELQLDASLVGDLGSLLLGKCA